MAFTFLYLSLFSWWFFYLIFIFYFSSLKFHAHFSPDVSSPCCSFLLTGTAGWILGGEAESVHVLLHPILWRVFILDLLGGFSGGRIAKRGPKGEIMSTMHRFIIFAEQ